MKSLLIALFLLPQLALATPVAGLLGRWEAQNEILAQDVKFRMSFNFTETETEMTVNCSFRWGAQLQASVSSLTKYEGNNVIIRETKEAVTRDGYYYCRATFTPSVWEAYFDGTGRLVLFSPAPYQARFFLVRAE